MGFVGNYAPVDFHHRLTACPLYEKMDVSCRTQKNIHLTPSRHLILVVFRYTSF